MNYQELVITSASVKVMRSFDYCHFEISLSSTDQMVTPEATDVLRKEAARLADKAVEQYKISKQNAQLTESDVYNLERLRGEAIQAESKPETERTPEEQAAIKYFRDKAFYQNRPHYDYQDDFSEPDWNEDDDGGAF